MSTDPFQPIPPEPGAGLNPVQPVTVQPVTVQPVAAQPRRGGRGAMFLNALLGLALVVAVGGVAFAAGRATAPASSGPGALAANGQDGRGFFVGPGASGAPDRGGRFTGPGAIGGGFSIEGTVEAIDATSMTIKTASGTTVTIALDGNTSYQKASTATAADVTSGSKVVVQLDGRGGNGGQGRPGASAAPGASGAPAVGVGTAGSVTVVP